MPFSLSLPPLVILLLLAFLWLILLVLLLWFAFRPRRAEEEPATRDRRAKPGRDGLEATLKAEQSGTDSSRASPRRTPTVRAVTPAERRASEPEPEAHDDFDDFNHARNRRDDFDF